MAVMVENPDGTITEYRNLDVVVGEITGEEIGQCDHCGVKDYADVLIRRGDKHYCDPCDGEMHRR